MTATVTSETTAATCTVAGSTVYTATVTFGEETYTDTKTVTIAALGHNWDYDNGTWSWADDYSAATGTIYCRNDASHTRTYTATVTSVTTPATAENDGLIVYTATVGSYSDTKTVILPALGWRMGHSLSLEGDIGVNFYYNLTDAEAENATVTFTFNGETTTQSLEKTDDGYRATFLVAAKEMAERITAVLTVGDEVKDTHAYRVRTYAMYIVNHPEEFSEELQTLAAAMLNYGARAQVYFNYDVSNLANADLADQTIADISTLSAPAFSATSLNNAVASYGIEYIGTTLVLESNTILRVYFNVTNATAFANPPSATIGGQAATWGSNADGVYIELADIAAQDIGNTVTITIGSYSYQYSAYNYINLVLGLDDEALLKETVTALYHYNQAAAAYFNSVA